MYHLDHLLQSPWAPDQRVPPTEAARFKSLYQYFFDGGSRDDFKALSESGRAPVFFSLAAQTHAGKKALPTY
jgi:hypothetical protein